jgi:Gram-negative porin
MSFRYTAAALAVLALSNARADDGPTFRFSGFGTVSAVHSNERQADFVGSSGQPNGAGFTRSTSLDPDSKLGGQVNAAFTRQWSAVVQVVAQDRYDNSYTPQLEWANVKYQLSPELSVRLGRTVTPTFMVSDSRLVGYANPMVRPPREVYGQNPLTSNDGVDATYRSTIGSVNNSFQAIFGGTTLKLPGNGTAKSKSTWSFNDSIDYGALTLRLSFLSGKTSFDIAGINDLLGGLDQFAAGAGAVPVPSFQAAGAQAAALSRKYKPDGIPTKVFALGAGYDPGDWFVSGEFAASRYSEGFLADMDGWYAIGGYRFGNLTPYASYASAKAKTKPEPGISTVGADPLAGAAAALNGGLNAVISSFSQSQRTVAVGLRWDFMTNLCLKTQYERISLGKDSGGYLVNKQPGLVLGGKVDLVTVAVDFVF